MSQYDKGFADAMNGVDPIKFDTAFHETLEDHKSYCDGYKDGKDVLQQERMDKVIYGD